MKSLYTRLSIAFVLILFAIGGGFYALDQWSTGRYYEELTQRLNASIAMYITGETSLIENGEVNREELALLSQRAMIINPTVEVYLLDPLGRILDQAIPPDQVQTAQVDLQPIQALMQPDAQLPIRGTDPRSARNKVFSVSPVTQDGELQGYLYAVLGGQQYEALADKVQESYVRTTSIAVLVALTLAAILAGLLLFSVLTQPLKRLTHSVNRFARSGFDPDQSGGSLVSPDQQREDEIGQLSRAFAGMSEKIRDQFKRLQETDRLRRELVSNVSHDLRTPLASMRGYVDTLLLKNAELSEDQREEYLTIARRHTLRLERLIGDLFELSKLEANAVTPEMEPFSLAELTHDVVQQFSLDAQKRGIDLTVKPVPSAAMVMADIGLVQRVLENLIRNALKFTPENGRVQLALVASAAHVEVRVTDTGCGMSKTELSQIFERHYHSAQSSRKDQQAAGLGLAIVKKILELHGSVITVKSRPQLGTQFTFALPVAG